MLNFCKDKKNFKLIKSLNYINFIKVAQFSEFIFTDSGGISEEGPSLKKDIFIARDKTERPEILSSGYVKIIGTDSKTILKKLLNRNKNKIKITNKYNPIGDGKASKRIHKIFKKVF